MYLTQRKTVKFENLDELLSKMETGELPVDVGDSFGIMLKNGTEVDMVVTDRDAFTIRLESRDCLGICTSAVDLNSYLEKVYDLLPEDLKKHIIEVCRIYIDGGSRFAKWVKLFVPAASEIFPAVENNSEEFAYDQLEWYKDFRNRIRTGQKNEDGSNWYWTDSTAAIGIDEYSSTVGYFGSAESRAKVNGAGFAPFCCVIQTK